MKKSRVKLFGVVFVLIATLAMYPIKSYGQTGDEIYGDASAVEQLKCLFNLCQNEYAITNNDNNNSGSSNPGGGSNPGQPGQPPSNPEPTTAIGTDCPIPSGRILCGSQTNPRNSCGHCGENYPAEAQKAYCDKNWGVEKGLDIAAPRGTAIYFPRIEGKIIEWEWKGSNQNIQAYGGVAIDNPDAKYWLQLHHTTTPRTAKGRSGDVAANICFQCFGSNETPHVHIQVGLGSTKPSGTNNWMDASLAFCN